MSCIYTEDKKRKNREYYIKNKELIIERSKLWAKNNPDARREIVRKNNEKSRIRKRIWHEYKVCEGKISILDPNSVCECCGGKDNLMIHHINGNHNDNSDGNHRILCRSCHAYHHGILRGGLNRRVDLTDA
jgi:hypothetical protein